jgi:sortase A
VKNKSTIVQKRPAAKRNTSIFAVLIILAALAVLIIVIVAQLPAPQAVPQQNPAPTKIQAATNSSAPTVAAPNNASAATTPAVEPTTSVAQQSTTPFENPLTVIPSTPFENPLTVVPPTPTLAPIPVVQSAIIAQVGTLPKAAHINIPAINVRAAVVEMGWLIQEQNGQQVTEWQLPENDVGHQLGSANPGEQGNVVLSGHNNLYAAVFRKLYTLKPGDQLTLFNTANRGFLYRVSQSYIVQEQDVSYEQQLANARVLLPSGDARLTLISCWPETNNTHRAIVIASLVGAVQ